MGYRIEYEKDRGYVKRVFSAPANSIIKNTLWFILGGLLVHILTVGVQMTLLTPREDVQAAVQQMVTEVRNGQSLDDAMETFYETVSG